MKTFLIGLLSVVCACNIVAYRGSQEHIRYLEEYIQDNQLPVPAFPMKDGPVVFEIEVDTCGVSS